MKINKSGYFVLDDKGSVVPGPAKKQPPPFSAGGVSSWNDLTDRPFYEETTTVRGDTLTWDGNTEGLESNGFGEDLPFFKVSDIVPTFEQILNGLSYISVFNGRHDETDVDPEYIQENTAISNGVAYYIMLDGVVLVFTTIDAPEAGLYMEKGIYFLMYDKENYVYSLTVPGFGGFVSEQTVIKPIDTKYLPEALQFGEIEAVGDTLTWDGNTEGLVMSSDGARFKVSDSVPSYSDFAGGYTVTAIMNGTSETVTLNQDTVQSFEDLLFLVDGFVAVVPPDAVGKTFEGEVTFTEAGIYLMKYNGVTVTSLTIPGYDGFVSKQTKPMDEKYMPILTSPNGTKYKITVADDGTLTTTAV